MRAIRAFLFRLNGSLRKPRTDRELAEEFENHLQMQIEDNLRAGMSAEQARREALLKSGGLETSKESCRDRRGLPLIETVLRDFAYALRQVRRSPGFATVVVLTLALGIGANTAIFSLLYGVLLRPLPYPQQERLVTMGEWSEQVPEMSVSYPNFLDWRARQKSFAAIGVASGQSFNYDDVSSTQRLAGALVSHDLFAALGVPVLRGRLFHAEDDRPGAERTVAISEGFWKRSFGGRESVIGEKIRLNKEVYTIIGVLSDAFQFPGGAPTEVWAPVGLWGDQYKDRWNHPGLYAIARLKPGVTFAEARTEMRAIAGQLAREYPATNTGLSVSMQMLTEGVFGGVRPMLFVLLGAAGFVLLIACSNVANLQLARAHARGREFAVRCALGAGRGRVVRQLLVESVLLGLLGCAVGLVLGAWSIGVLRTALPSTIPRLQEIGLNLRVLAFSVGVSLLTSIVFGLVPATSIGRQSLPEVLAQDGRAGGAARGHRWRAALMVSEFALTCMLLIGASLMLRTLGNLHHANPGYSTGHVVTFDWDLPDEAYPGAAQRLPLIEHALARLAAVPGAAGVALVNPLPLSGQGNQSYYYVEGTPAPDSGKGPSTERIEVSGDYFHALGVRLLAGRTFSSADQPQSLRVAIVDTVFAEKNSHGQNPIGKRFAYETHLPAKESGWLQVVGVVSHVENNGLGGPSREQTYVPFTQSPPSGMTFAVRTDGDPASLAPALRGAMREVSSGLPVFNFHTMDELFAASISSQRLTVLLLGTFAGIALLLAAVGLYGVLSYNVSQRTREIGVRMALGAASGSVVGLVLRNGLRLAGIGLALGLLTGLGLTQLLRGLLYEVSTFDPMSFAAVAAVLISVGIFACWWPARRAAKVDPVVALRNE
jgi:putative ABC transport system permease protein